jgi:hypothetical protein
MRTRCGTVEQHGTTYHPSLSHTIPGMLRRGSDHLAPKPSAARVVPVPRCPDEESRRASAARRTLSTAEQTDHRPRHQSARIERHSPPNSSALNLPVFRRGASWCRIECWQPDTRVASVATGHGTAAWGNLALRPEVHQYPATEFRNVLTR